MKKLLCLYLLLFSFSCFAQQVSICSWNLKDFGKSKSDAEILFVAKTISSFDVIAIQEVVAGYGGSQAVIKLVDQMNRRGSKWDYTISNVTSGSSYKSERYAFIWKVPLVKKVGDAWLEQKLNSQIDREPFFCRFKVNEKVFTIVNFHAITKSKQPETEIKYFKFLPSIYPNDNLIFCGDFNLPQSHTVFIPLRKMGYISAFVGQKTSLKMECVNEVCLRSEFDNFFFNKMKLQIKRSGIIEFYKSFRDLKSARLVSDHIPIYIEAAL
jgi:endonuclease/exonuclease/phosphatase family metal-dependent hydrolase